MCCEGLAPDSAWCKQCFPSWRALWGDLHVAALRISQQGGECGVQA